MPPRMARAFGIDTSRLAPVSTSDLPLVVHVRPCLAVIDYDAEIDAELTSSRCVRWWSVAEVDMDGMAENAGSGPGPAEGQRGKLEKIAGDRL